MFVGTQDEVEEHEATCPAKDRLTQLADGAHFQLKVYIIFAGVFAGLPHCGAKFTKASAWNGFISIVHCKHVEIIFRYSANFAKISRKGLNNVK